MTNVEKNPEVDGFLGRAKTWRQEFERLRAIVLEFDLREELKWGHPCYVYQSRNVVLMHGFKYYCALLFFKGALLRDDHRILVRQTENVQAGRQIRFAGLPDIVDREAVVKAYVREAVEVEKAGLKVNLKTTADFAVPEEFQGRLEESRELESAFAGLTPGRRRGYLLYFAAPKQSKTRHARIEKCVPRILAGKGLDD